MPKKRGRARFTVEGSGAFPFDMLRYDHAWPEKESTDSHQLGLTFYEHGESYLEKRRVTLLSDSPFAPTRDRWNSFNWRVVNAEEVA